MQLGRQNKPFQQARLSPGAGFWKQQIPHPCKTLSPTRRGANARRLMKQCRAASESCASTSRIITQEILLFCFQQDLDSALTRALNTDQMERAQSIRERLQVIDEAVEEIQAVKQSGGEASAPNLQAAFSRSVQLRAGLQEAIMEERYEEAAKLRDQLKGVQEQLDAASNKAEQASRQLKQQRQLALGQRVLHKQLGYRGVVCGWDAACSESKEWQQAANVDQLQNGTDQPFYQLLVDVRDSRNEEWEDSGLVAYVAQELLSTPEPPLSWVEEHGDESLENPFIFNLFLGTDERGDLIPTRALRDKFGQERRDVDPPTSMQDDGGDGDGGDDDLPPSPNDEYRP